MKILSKKGSLSLSMNAIVVIILAIAMIGVGLFIIQGIVSKADIQIPSHWPNGKADTNNPIVFHKTEYSIKQGNEQEFYVSVYNTGTESLISLDLTNCEDVFDFGEGETNKIVLEERGLNARTEGEFGFILKTRSDALIQKNFCSFTDSNGNSKDLLIEIIG